MGLLFGGKPEEVPFRRKILRYNNWKRIEKNLDPKMDCHVIPEEGELYEGHKTLANVYMVCRGASRGATRLTA